MSDKAKLIEVPVHNGIENTAKRYGTFSSSYIADNQRKEQRCYCSRRDRWVLIILMSLAAITITTTLAVGIPSIQNKKNLFQLFRSSKHKIQKTSEYKNAAIASDDPRCSEIGSKIMKRHGSAVDAAISTLLCLEVVHPHHSGIGGGFFMTIYDTKNKKSMLMDAREYAPANIPLNASLRSGLAVGVPLTLDGYWKIHQQFGRLKWAELFQPTIDLCVKGYRVDSILADAIEKAKDFIMKESSLSELFIDPKTGNLLKENDFLKRPVHAQTLGKIAREGISSFYNGSIGQTLVSEIQQKGGVITLEDLANAKSSFRQPLNASIAMQNLTILTVPPPSSGSLLVFMLNILGQFSVSDDEATNYQRIAESMKFAAAQRTLLGDPAFVDIKQAVDNQTSINFAKITSDGIVDNETFSSDYYIPEGSTSKDGGTTHVSVIDENGLVVAVTCTVNNRFGAKFRSTSLDIILNDELNDFSQANSTANLIQPGKKPLSSMLPTIFLDRNGEVVLVIGGAGGRRILTAVTMATWNYLHRKASLTESIALPRIHHELFPNILDAEKTVPKSILLALQSFGHNITLSEANLSHLNAIARITNGNWVVVSDPRIESGVAGF